MAKKTPLSSYVVLALMLGLSVFQTPAFGNSVDEILQQAQPPAGVVFEIVSGQTDNLRKTIPIVRQHVQRLRERFPDIEIAVVTHGKEQFSLTQKDKKNYAGVHKQIQSLVKDAKVPVHVCETYAGWKNIDASEFPDYVDVAAAGPAQVNDYRELGYILIKLD